MNVRILPLIFVTAIFMFAWNGDQKAMHAAIVKRDAIQSVLLAEAYGRKSLSIDEARHVSAAALPSQQAKVHVIASATETSEVPLPVGIAIGEYQAVHQSGKTVRVSVSADRLVDETQVSRDFYISDSAKGDRWYLVRIQTIPSL